MNPYQARDGRWFWLLGLESDRHWPGICRAVEHPEWCEQEPFASSRGRRKQAAVVIQALDEVFATQDRDEWTRRFDVEGVWWAPVHSVADVVTDPQAIAAGAFVDVPAGAGAVAHRAVATPVTFGGARRGRRTGAGPGGAHGRGAGRAGPRTRWTSGRNSAALTCRPARRARAHRTRGGEMDSWIVDSRPSARYPIYTRANVGEVFPDPVTPLTATIGITPEAEPGWREAFARFGALDLDEYDPDNNEIIGVFGGYCYLNVTISRILGVRTPGLTPEIIDATFFGTQPGIPPYQPQATDERPDLTERVGATLQWILTTPDRADLMVEQEAMEALRDARPDLTTFSDQELVDRARDLMTTHFRRVFGEHIFTTYCATVPTGILQQAAAAAGDPMMAMHLIAGVGDVESAQPSMIMWDLGRIAAASAGLTAAFEAGIVDLPARLADLAAAGDEDAVRFNGGFDGVPARARVSRAERVGDAVAHLGDASRAGAGRHRPDAGVAGRRPRPGRSRPSDRQNERSSVPSWSRRWPLTPRRRPRCRRRSTRPRCSWRAVSDRRRTPSD